MSLYTKTLSFIVVLLLLVTFSYSTAAVEFSGNVTGVSTYVWRAVKQGNGPALQGNAGFTAGMVSFGLWTSSVDFGEVESETDPYLEVALPTGSVSTTIGVTIYSYDFFEAFNDGADFEYELYAKFGVGPVGIAAFFEPSQGSTENDLNDSNYWLEASTGTAFMGADLGLTFGYGTYTSRYISVPTKDAVASVLLSASKAITEDLSASWNYSLGLSDDMDNQFWTGISYGF